MRFNEKLSYQDAFKSKKIGLDEIRNNKEPED